MMLTRPRRRWGRTVTRVLAAVGTAAAFSAVRVPFAPRAPRVAGLAGRATVENAPPSSSSSSSESEAERAETQSLAATSGGDSPSQQQQQQQGIRAALEQAAKSTTTTTLGARVRPEFPALDQETRPGTRLVYLDSGATSQKPKSVLETERAFYERDNANVHRGAHTLATRATESYEAAREKVARFVNAPSSREIVWTRGATEAINLVAQSWAATQLEAGDEIVLTVVEHHANLVPWQLLAERKKGVKLKFARLERDETNGGGERVDAAHLQSLVTNRTKLIAMAHVSNVLGYELPVDVAVDAARTRGAPGCAVLLDACQSVPHAPVDVQALGVDFVVASGHKMCGPTGIGFLWGKRDRLEVMTPWQGGGEMIDRVALDGTTFAPPPARFEAGTPPIAQAVALGAACDYLSAIGMDAIKRYEKFLADRLLAGLRDRERSLGVTVYGPRDARDVALVAFNVDGIHASDLAFFLDQEGVATRAGHHCCQPLHHALDADSGTCRASLALYNTPEDVDTFLAKLDQVVAFVKSSDEDALLSSSFLDDDDEDNVVFAPLPSDSS